jgi:chemotaxis protein histidine kinase CheA
VDRIKEMMNQLAELGADQVTELQEQIVAEFEAVENEEPSSQTVDAMTSLAEMLEAVRGEVKQREAAVQELAQRAAEAASRVYGDDAKEDMTASKGKEEMKDEETTSSDSEAAMDSEEEKVVPEPDVPAMPASEEMKDEAPVAESETPTESDSEMEEDEMEKKKTMSEASTELSETTELSIENETVSEASAEETITAAADEDKVVEVEAEEASVETAVESEAAVETAEVEKSTEEVASIKEDAEAEASVDSEVEAATEVEGSAEAATNEETTSNAAELSAQETMEAPVTASAENADNLDLEVPADRRLASKETASPVAITAGADIPGYTAGSTLDDMSTVAEAMAKRLHALRRVNGGDGEQHIVASITQSYPESRTLTSDAESNRLKISNLVSPEAIVAAGGHVAPFEARYDVFGNGSTARPVRDALPRFQADRGGIRYVTPPKLSSYADAVGVWTAANDAAETPSPSSKLSLTVEAAAENTVATDAVTLQLQFGNLATRAYPELISRHNELGLIQHAREAEQNLLAKITSASTAVTTTNLIGFGRDFLVQIGRAASAYRSRHRLEADAPLRIIIPTWVKDAMAADLALSMPGDSTLNAYAEIDGYIASRGVIVSYSLDQNVFGAQGATALVEFSDTFTWYLFAEGTFLFLDGGTLDLGIIRDSTLVGTNDYKMFVETFEGIAMVGVEALAVTSTINVNGAAAALRDTLGGVASAVIEL